MIENEVRGRLLAQAYWAELEKIGSAWNAVGGFLRAQATRVAGKATGTGVEQTAQRFARDAAGKMVRGRRTFSAAGEGATLGQKARAVGATALDWAGHNPRTAAAVAGGSLLAAGAAPGFVAGRSTH